MEMDGSVLKTYFLIKGIGRLNLSIVAKSPESNSKIEASINGKKLNVSIAKSSTYAVIDLGYADLTATGFYRVEIRGVSKTGNYFPDIQSVVVSGPAANNIKYNKSTFRGAPATHLSYPFPAGNSVEYFYTEINVLAGADPLYSYYMSNGFSGGYFGIQVNSPTERRVLFSIWSAYDTNSSSEIPADYTVKLIKKGAGVTANDFENEGAGGQSYLKFNWKTETTYKGLIRAQISGTNTIYTAWFWAPENNSWKLIAQWDKPKSGTYMSGLYSFVENFSNNGSDLFKCRYGNQWVKNTTGDWIQLTKANFSTTANETTHQRYAPGADIEGNWMYMYSGGFLTEGFAAGSQITGPSGSVAPDISNLPEQ